MLILIGNYLCLVLKSKISLYRKHSRVVAELKDIKSLYEKMDLESQMANVRETLEESQQARTFHEDLVIKKLDEIKVSLSQYSIQMSAILALEQEILKVMKK